MDKQTPICSECNSWMLEKDGWLKCVGCGYQKKVTKRIIKPIGKDSLTQLGLENQKDALKVL